MSGLQKCEFIWRIENFNSSLPKIGNELFDYKCLSSPNFSFYVCGYTQWYLELYPKSGRSNAFIKCLPICMDYSKDCFVNCELSILDENDNVHSTKKMKCRCSSIFHCDFSNAIELERCKLPIQNDLIFRCKLSYEENDDETQKTNRDFEGLSQDLLNFYKSQNFCDLTLCVGKEKLQVHRTILCIRAPKLAEILGIQDSETITSTVNVKDISLLTLKALLNYVYSGKIEGNLDAILHELCNAVKQYNLDALKSELLPVTTQSTALTRIKSKKGCFIWPISNFSSFKEAVLKFIDLDMSQFEASFALIKPNQNSFQLTFKALTYPESKQIYLRCKLSAVDVDGNLVLSSDHIHHFESDVLTKKLGVASKEKWEFPTVIKESDLQSNKCLIDGMLKLNMELEVSEGDKISKIVNVKKTLKEFPNTIVHLSNLSNDLFEIFKIKNRPGVSGEYYDGDCYNDITLKVGNGEVFCHKDILRARSAEFSRMLQDTKQDTLNLTGIDHETLLLMVQYLYSGLLSNLAVIEAARLYIAAEKYQIPELTKKCISLLEKSLTIQNVCDVLLLADKFSNDAMFNSAVEYMKYHKSNVLESNEWKELYRRNPVLSTKAIEKMCEKINRRRQFYCKRGAKDRSSFRLW